jgi:hypothetical protein
VVREPEQLAEIQGIYGPVTVSERLLQRIWLRGDYQREGLRTESGRSVRIRQPGRWNLLEGPDFLGADLELDGERLSGDVEIHFHVGDWYAHGHDRQERFDGVVLHVVLFPPNPREKLAQTSKGEEPEVLVLLPRLNSDLESYAADEVLRSWEGRDMTSLLEGFFQLTADERLARLVDKARRRFFEKVAFVRKRLEKDSWDQVCHQLTMEILGYRRNRAPMAALALVHPPECMSALPPEEMYREQLANWKLVGLRPANHPLRRLGQYVSLWREKPDWTMRLREWGKTLGATEMVFDVDTRVYRKSVQLSRLRRKIEEEVLGRNLGGSRLDTWMVDGALPLLAVDCPKDWFGLWYHWFVGDMPELLGTFVRRCELPEVTQRRCNGLYQGGWQVFLESGF